MVTKPCAWLLRAAVACTTLFPVAESQIVEEFELPPGIESPGDARDYTRDELQKMLDEVPRWPKGTVGCGTGVRWFEFAFRPPHTAKTVSALTGIFRDSEDLTAREHILWVLQKEVDLSLRGFWLSLLEDTHRPPEWEPVIIAGLGKVGTEEDLLRLTKRLGESREFDLALLRVLGDRRLVAARAAALLRYRDREAPSEVRAHAFWAALRMPHDDRDTLVEEGLSDPMARIRAEAVKALAGRPNSRDALLRMLADGDPSVRRTTVVELGKQATADDCPALAGMLADADDGVRWQAEGALFGRFLADGLTPETHARNYGLLLKLSEDPNSGLFHSPRMLLQLGWWAETHGELDRAEAFYRQGREVAAKRPGQFDPNFDASATICLRLARLRYLRGDRDEALRLAMDLRDQYGERTRVYSRDYPFGGGGMSETAREMGERLVDDFTNTPVRIDVSALAETFHIAEPVRLKVGLTNVTSQPLTVTVYPAYRGGWLPDARLIVALNRRHHFAGINYGRNVAHELQIRPGDGVGGEMAVSAAYGPTGPVTVDVFASVQCTLPDGRRWSGRLQGITSVVRLEGNQ
jgi:hypothetical protein